MANVTKKEIVEAISQRTGLTQNETKAIFESLLGAISRSLEEGRNVELRGFGRFKVRERRPREAHNPRTGETVAVPGGSRPVFEASRELRMLLNAPERDLAALQKALGESLPDSSVISSKDV